MRCLKPKLTPDQVREIFFLRQCGEKYADLAKRFNMTESGIWRVLSGSRHKAQVAREKLKVVMIKKWPGHMTAAAMRGNDHAAQDRNLEISPLEDAT